MALARKLKKEEFDKLPEAIKGEYLKVGENYVLDLSGEDEALTAARGETTAEKKRRLELEDQLRQLGVDAATAREEALRAAGDIAGLEKEWQGKVEAARNEGSSAATRYVGMVERLLIDSTAGDMAKGLSSRGHKLIQPLIRDRMGVDMTGDEPVLFVKGPDGKRSEMTPDALRQEFYSNADYAAIIDGSKASGGGNGNGQRQQPSQSQQQNGAFRTEQPNDLSKASPADLVAHINASKQ